MLLTWLGAMLVICGVLFMAAQAIWRGRLSHARQAQSPGTGPTLEPKQRAAGFGLSANWPGFLLVGVGAVLLFLGFAA